jgi:hypothetical protein
MDHDHGSLARHAGDLGQHGRLAGHGRATELDDEVAVHVEYALFSTT